MPDANWQYVHCAADDPLRCKANGGSGDQCPYLSLAGMARDGHFDSEDPNLESYSKVDTCPRHRGYNAASQFRQKKVHDLRLGIWQRRVSELAESEQAKNLRGEIGVLRLMLESLVERCTNSQELMIYSQKISDLIVKIEKLVTSCHKLELTFGSLLDKSAILMLAGKVVELVSRHVSDPVALDEISTGIIDAMAEMV